YIDYYYFFLRLKRIVKKMSEKDGDIVDVDGISPLSFFGTPNSYYVAVRHRNHTGFRTDNKIALSARSALSSTGKVLRVSRSLRATLRVPPLLKLTPVVKFPC
ncbi:MAG: hypothetical protein RLZZ69_1705, partial [Cyanobacteriota bacterium]